MKSVVILILMFSLIGCNQIGKWSNNETKKEFKYNRSISHYNYSVDSIKLTTVFHQMVEGKIIPYHGKKYDDSTKIYIDTIIYSPDNLYAALFVIMRCYNGSMTDSYRMNKDGYHFNGTVHFVKKIHNISADDSWKISTHHGVKYFLSENYNKIHSILRNENFNGRNGIATWDVKILYNLDDVRFWRSEEFNFYKNDEFVDFRVVDFPKSDSS